MRLQIGLKVICFALHLHQVTLCPKASYSSHAQSLYAFKLPVVLLTTIKKAMNTHHFAKPTERLPWPLYEINLRPLIASSYT